MRFQFIIFALSLAASFAADTAFQPIFDGRTLTGWHTPESAFWTVEDGAITGRITKDRPCNTNQYLLWTGGDLADFELKLKSRLNGEGGINNGFQFRSRLLPDHDICGYQVDNNLKTDWLVRLYDEYGRHDLALRGERAIFDQNGERTTARLHEPADPAWFKLEDWHEYHLICINNKITVSIDGRLACEVEDNDPRRRELQGIFALQLHSGPPTIVQFKDIQLKILKPAVQLAKPPEPTEAQLTLQKQALAWWPLDTGGHGAKPWLHLNPAFYQFQMNVRAAGPNATPNGNVIIMQGAHFEADPTLLSETKAFTLHIRARDPKSKWDSALITKFDAFAMSGSAFSVNSDQGWFQITAPLSTDAWTDITARYDGSKIDLFHNGKQVATKPCTGTIRSNKPLLLAAKFDGLKVLEQFLGELELAALWPRALTDSEIAALPNGSSAK